MLAELRQLLHLHARPSHKHKPSQPKQRNLTALHMGAIHEFAFAFTAILTRP
jgi:hypothetical protein